MPPSEPPPPRGYIIVVIGAGATGALTAVRLLEAGYRVIIIEKVAPGNGSSSRSAACIRAQWTNPDNVVGMMYSEHWYTQFYDQLKIPENDRQGPVIQQNGYLWLYEHPELRESWHAGRSQRESGWRQACEAVDMQQALSLPVELLTPEEVAKRWPHLAQMSEQLIGATLCPTDGFLRPDMVYNFGIARARALGAQVHLRTELIGASIVGGKIVKVITSDGEFACDMVINCTNAWAPRVSRAMGGMDLPIQPTKRYLGFQERPTNRFTDEQWRQLPMTIYGLGDGRGCYSRPEGEQQLMIGWAHKSEPNKSFTDEDQDRIENGYGHDHRDGGMPYTLAMQQQVRDFSPQLAEGAMTGTTCGYYGITPDESPLIGTDARLPNLVHACGFSGHGLMHAPITAVLVQAIVEGEKGAVSLPDPFEGNTMNLNAFAPTREFAAPEGLVI